MFQHITIALMALSVILPIGIFFLGEQKVSRFKKSLCLNMVSFFGVLIFATVFMFTGNVSAADTVGAVPNITDNGFRFLGAALSTGLCTIGTGIATGSAASAALGALSENDKIMGKALIFVAMAEGIAIYGLLISFMILYS